jgi:hypothetical protein
MTSSIFDKIGEISNLTEGMHFILTKKNREIKEMLAIIEEQKPTHFRGSNDNIWRTFERITNDYSIINEEVEKNIRSLNEIKNILNINLDLINNAKTVVNKKTIGTLEGITRDVIRQRNIVPEEGDIIRTAVLEQPYDEKAALNRGGRKTQNKRKNKKTRKNRKRH